MSYRLRSPVEATQWFKNGDHPWDAIGEPFADGSGFRTEGKLVRRFRHPDRPGDTACALCGNAMDDHGWLDDPSVDGQMICPGDWVISVNLAMDIGGLVIEHYAMKPAQFAATYEEV